jgi:hypothetical protein
MSDLPDTTELTVGDVEDALRDIKAMRFLSHSTRDLRLLAVLKASHDYPLLCDWCEANLGVQLSADTIGTVIGRLATMLHKPFAVVRTIPLADAVRLLGDAAPDYDSAEGGTKNKTEKKATGSKERQQSDAGTEPPKALTLDDLTKTARDTGRDTNTRVKEQLERNPNATSVDIRKTTGLSDKTVRRSKAWREHRKGHAQKNPKSVDALDRRRPMTASMLAAIESRTADPAEIVAEREAESDTEIIEPIDLLRGRFSDQATPSQRAHLNRLPPAEQEMELRAWDMTGVFLPDEPPIPGPLRRRIQRHADPTAG